MAVPMVDLPRQYAALRGEIHSAIDEVLDSQMLVMLVGRPLPKQQKQLSESLSGYCGCSHAVPCSSGTDALLAMMMALGVGAGDEVVCPAFTFFATASCAARVGARPVFADIDPRTFNLDPAAAGRAVTGRTKAVIPVHLFGQMAEMETLCRLGEQRGLTVIEDAAQAIGAKRHGRPAGSWGKAAALSFYPTKNLNALGDAGMIVTGDADFARTCQAVCVHGDTGGYNHVRLGGNFRMDELQAAALNVKFKYLEAWNRSRRAHAAIYDRVLGRPDGVTVPHTAAGNEHVYNQYVIRAADRDGLIAHLKDRQIGCAVFYPRGLHQLPCFADLGYRAGDFPETERACREVLALPVCPELSDEQIEEAAASVREFYGR